MVKKVAHGEVGHARLVTSRRMPTCKSGESFKVVHEKMASSTLYLIIRNQKSRWPYVSHFLCSSSHAIWPSSSSCQRSNLSMVHRRPSSGLARSNFGSMSFRGTRQHSISPYFQRSLQPA